MSTPDVKISPGAYDRWRSTSLGAFTEEVEHQLLWEMIGDPGPRLVLDAGCGDGLLARQARERGARVVGLDPDPAMLTAAARQGDSSNDGPWWVNGRLQDLPVKNACCDLVLAVTVLCFLSASESQKAMAEMARVLKPGGRLILGELSPYSLWALRRRLRGWLGSSLWRRVHFRSPKALKKMALEAGLQIEAMRGAVFYPPWWWAARRMAAWDKSLSDRTTLGAAFLVLAVSKLSQAVGMGEMNTSH